VTVTHVLQLKVPIQTCQTHSGTSVQVPLHVGDLIAATTSESMIISFEGLMNEVLTMKDLGNLHHYLGLQMERER